MQPEKPESLLNVLDMMSTWNHVLSFCCRILESGAVRKTDFEQEDFAGMFHILEVTRDEINASRDFLDKNMNGSHIAFDSSGSEV